MPGLKIHVSISFLVSITVTLSAALQQRDYRDNHQQVDANNVNLLVDGLYAITYSFQQLNFSLLKLDSPFATEVEETFELLMRATASNSIMLNTLSKLTLDAICQWVSLCTCNLYIILY